MLVYFGVGCPLPQNRETEKKNGYIYSLFNVDKIYIAGFASNRAYPK